MRAAQIAVAGSEALEITWLFLRPIRYGWWIFSAMLVPAGAFELAGPPIPGAK
jgi:hypothetical protein